MNTPRRVGYNLILVCDADPSTVRGLVPSPLTVEIEGTVLVWWQRHHIFGVVGPGEFADPMTYSFAEVVVKVPCLLDGKSYNYTTMGWCDNENLMHIGRAHGIPQRLGRVAITEFSPADDEYDRPREGQSISAHMQSHGTEITSRLNLDVHHPQGQEPMIPAHNAGHRKVVDDVRGRTVLDDIYAGWAADYEMLDFWQGNADCSVVANADSPIHPIGNLQARTGYFFFSRFSGASPDRSIPFDYLQQH